MIKNSFTWTLASDQKCRTNALRSFAHTGKIDAILGIAYRIAIDGFDTVKNATRFYGVNYLQTFDYIGPATSYHLAKNIGLPVAKPDRHIRRIANAVGFSSVDELCNQISLRTGDPVPVVDLVIWRFATIRTDYLSWFKCEG